MEGQPKFPNGGASDRRFPTSFSALGTIGIGVLFIAILLAVLLYFDMEQQVISLLDWVDSKGAVAPLLFILIMALVVILLLPGIMFTVGGGFVFGVTEGSICIIVGTTLGAAVAFLTARHLFGARAARYLQNHVKLKLISDEMIPHGWKLVLLTRLVPFFPFKLSNYLFGLTRFSLGGFTAGTLLGIVPFSVHNAYLGSIAAEIAVRGNRTHQTPADWAVYIAGFLAIVIMVIYVNRLARRALQKYAAEEQEAGT
jgi:uncharacterized membrane protein YdjX (TVP38/TMEM64 family)